MSARDRIEARDAQIEAEEFVALFADDASTTAPELSDEEREVVARFEAAPVLEEAWEEPWDEILAPGTPVEVHDLEGGGYVVVPLNRGMGLS